MSLREIIKPLTGNKRRFFLLRLTDMSTNMAMELTGITRGTYNTWLHQQDFVELYRQRDELSSEYRQEAIQLLRRDNQLEAVLLEKKVIEKMREELDTGEYSLIRSHLAREVYSKLIADLDTVPQTQVLTWEQRVANIFTQPPVQIQEGEIIDGELATDNQQEAEYPPS